MLKAKGVMFFTLAIMLMAFSCSGPESDQPLLTAEVPLHLEEHIDDARIEGSEVPENLPVPVVWNFSEPQPDWKALPLRGRPFEPTRRSWTDNALRVTPGKSTEEDSEYAGGGIYIDVPDWAREDWARVQVRARTSDKVNLLGLRFNLPEESETDDENTSPYLFRGESATVINDGSVQTYSLRADWSRGRWEGPWRQLILTFFAEKPGSIDILSVSVIPKEHIYADAPVGVRSDECTKVLRRTLYSHAPGRIEYRVRIPQAGRLDVGLGVIKEDNPVTFRVVASQNDELHFGNHSTDMWKDLIVEIENTVHIRVIIHNSHKNQGRLIGNFHFGLEILQINTIWNGAQNKLLRVGTEKALLSLRDHGATIVEGGQRDFILFQLFTL